ncbi:MAG: 50S ribosomal protein L22 [bacterium]
MEITVKKLFAKISPRKARIVLYGLRNQTLLNAKNSLTFTNKKAAGLLLDLVKAAIGAAKENYLEADKTYIKSIAVNEGPRLKRHMPKSKGRTYNMQKRMSHFVLTITDQLGEDEKVEKSKLQKDNKKAE